MTKGGLEIKINMCVYMHISYKIDTAATWRRVRNLEFMALGNGTCGSQQRKLSSRLKVVD